MAQDEKRGVLQTVTAEIRIPLKTRQSRSIQKTPVNIGLRAVVFPALTGPGYDCAAHHGGLPLLVRMTQAQQAIDLNSAKYRVVQ
jgi:hypothetical protein